jgi:hypothetical protein
VVVSGRANPPPLKVESSDKRSGHHARAGWAWDRLSVHVVPFLESLGAISIVGLPGWSGRLSLGVEKSSLVARRNRRKFELMDKLCGRW